MSQGAPKAGLIETLFQVRTGFAALDAVTDSVADPKPIVHEPGQIDAACRHVSAVAPGLQTNAEFALHRSKGFRLDERDAPCRSENVPSLRKYRSPRIPRRETATAVSTGVTGAPCSGAM